MCGIVGYAGTENTDRSRQVVMGGLARLEYRGYDSAGIAVGNREGLTVVKAVGKLANLEAALAENPALTGQTAIGHTRWATHGVPSTLNAHPHVAADGDLALVHNGIIENAAALKKSDRKSVV